MNAEKSKPIRAVAMAIQLPTLGALNEIAGIDAVACDTAATRFKIHDKGSGSKIKSLN